MAYTDVEDIIIPEIYLPYEYLKIIEKSKFFSGGIITPNAMITEKLNGGGDMFKVPARILATTAAVALQSGTSITPEAGSTAQANVRRCLLGKGWAEEELASALAGSRPEFELPELTAQFWANEFEDWAIAGAKGIFANNIANGSDLVNDIAAADGGAAIDSNKVSADAIIDTSMLLTDRIDAFEGGGIAMRSEVYTRLLKLNLIDFVPTADQAFSIPTYQTMSVVVDNSLPAVAADTGYDYWTILYEKGSVGFGEGGYQFITPIETDRTAASGVDNLYMRKQFGFSFKGFSWATSETIINETPTLAEYDDADNWTRVQDDARTSGMALLVTSG